MPRSKWLKLLLALVSLLTVSATPLDKGAAASPDSMGARDIRVVGSSVRAESVSGTMMDLEHAAVWLPDTTPDLWWMQQRGEQGHMSLESASRVPDGEQHEPHTGHVAGCEDDGQAVALSALLRRLQQRGVVHAGAGGQQRVQPRQGWDSRGGTAHRQTELQRRCRMTRPGWCGGYQTQTTVPSRPTPRGSKECPRSCSGVGNCNHDTGTCDCPAGSQGDDCGTVLLRPCTHSFRERGPMPLGHIDEEGRDLDLTVEGYTESRCTGICDPFTARCFCDGKYRRVNPPQGAPPGTPAPVRGRPLPNHLCQANNDSKGTPLPWGQVPWEQLYGPNGWCNSDTPVISCPCLFDGFSGPLCDEVTECMCVNQCSGHGECDSGFCKCHRGWYGTDCARRAAGLPLESGMHERGARPWLGSTAVTPPELVAAAGGGEGLGTSALAGDQGAAAAAAAMGDGAGAAESAAAAAVASTTRRRPLIYVYDLPPAYNSRLLQYRNEKGLCTWRGYGSGNRTELVAWTYGLEVLLHELMLRSEHRTFDPEAADFFYVPVYGTCMIFPVHCYADGPWFHVPSGPRVMHVTNMMLAVRDWIRQHFPYWDRRGGRDHIWAMLHDEGACYAPTEIYKSSIMLTHWGRTDLVHASNTAFTPDNYTQEYVHPEQPDGWLHRIQGHPCYTPGKDLVIPALKLPFHYASSPLLFHPPFKRDILLYLRGDMGTYRLPMYSRGIRQRLYAMWKERGWKERYNVLIGEGADIPGPYSEQLARSKFCIVAPGDGWSPRMEDAVLHGCVPVILMDGVRGVWEDQLHLDKASLRFNETDLEGLPERLAAVPPRELEAMQRRLRRVWHRYAWMSHPLIDTDARNIISANVDKWRRVPLRKGGSGGPGGMGGPVAGAGAAAAGSSARRLQAKGSEGADGSTSDQWDEYEYEYDYNDDDELEAKQQGGLDRGVRLRTAGGSEEVQAQHRMQSGRALRGDSSDGDGGDWQDGSGGPGAQDLEADGTATHRVLLDRGVGSGGAGQGQGRGADAAGGAEDGARREAFMAALRARARFPAEDDAFATLLQWLYSRIPHTR